MKGEEFSEGGTNFTSKACKRTLVVHTICPRHFFREEIVSPRGRSPPSSYGPGHQMMRYADITL